VLVVDNLLCQVDNRPTLSHIVDDIPGQYQKRGLKRIRRSRRREEFFTSCTIERREVPGKCALGVRALGDETCAATPLSRSGQNNRSLEICSTIPQVGRNGGKSMCCNWSAIFLMSAIGSNVAIGFT
jgi:hypothetical protein